jgi:tetratricopeptide (TPR) repeat protein
VCRHNGPVSFGRSLSRLLSLRWLRSPASRTRAWEDRFQEGVEALQTEDLPGAERAFAMALDEAEGFPPGDVRLTVTLDNLAAVLRVEGKNAEAAPLCARALAIKERVFGPESPNVASTLKDLAEIHRQLGHAAEAAAYHERAREILKKAIGPDFEELEESLRRSPVLGDGSEHDPLRGGGSRVALDAQREDDRET